MKKILSIGLLSAVLFGGILSSTEAEATSIKNGAMGWESVSVSAWGHDASYSAYNLLPGQTEYWDRGDSRGVLVDTYRVGTYYVESDFNGETNENGTLQSHNTGKQLSRIDLAGPPQGSSNTVKIVNNSSVNKEVSVSKWTESDDGRAFKITPNSSETWTRNDNRGYILNAGGPKYFIRKGKTVTINNTRNIIIDGKQYAPMTMGK